MIAFDWPGMGASDGWPGGTMPQHMADHLRDLLDAWGLARAGVLGMDMGGPRPWCWPRAIPSGWSGSA